MIEPWGGLANRIRVILAAKIFCEESQLNLDINWIQKPLTKSPAGFYRSQEIADGHFLDVFKPLVSSSECKINFLNAEQSDKAMREKTSVFYKGTDIKEFKKRIIDFELKYTEAHKALRPLDFIQNKIASKTRNKKPTGASLPNQKFCRSFPSETTSRFPAGSQTTWRKGQLYGRQEKK